MVVFCILSYNFNNSTSLLKQIVRHLKRDPRAAVVIHHDFDQTNIPESDLAEMDCPIVRPHFKTSWGSVNVIRGLIECYKLGFKTWPDAKWFVQLSANDYPVKPISEIIDQLYSSDTDGYMNYREVNPKALELDYFFWRDVNHRIVARIPIISRKGLPYYYYLRKLVDITPFFPKDSVRLFAGEAHYIFNRKVTNYLSSLDLLNHPTYKWLLATSPLTYDENLFQNILLNFTQFQFTNNPKRYIDWDNFSENKLHERKKKQWFHIHDPRNDNKWHPKILGPEDFDKISRSDAWFGRKVELPYSELLVKRLDSEVLK